MKTNLTLLQMNDFHGYLAPHSELIWTAEGPEFPKKVSADLARIMGKTPMALHREACLDAPMDDLLWAAVARAAGLELRYRFPTAGATVHRWQSIHRSRRSR